MTLSLPLPLSLLFLLIASAVLGPSIIPKDIVYNSKKEHILTVVIFSICIFFLLVLCSLLIIAIAFYTKELFIG